MGFLYYHLWMSDVLLLVIISLLSQPSAYGLTPTDYLKLGPNNYCQKIIRVDNRNLKRNFELDITSPSTSQQCLLPWSKTCSLTYKLSDVLYKAYRFCGYFDRSITVPCDISLKMDYYLSFNDNNFETLTCRPPRPYKYCPPKERELRISYTSRDVCPSLISTRLIEIKLEPIFSDTIHMFTKSTCYGIQRHDDSGTVQSQYEPDWPVKNSYCNVKVDSQWVVQKRKFCMEFVTFMGGPALVIKVDQCVMKLGGDNNYLTTDKVCQPWNKAIPVSVDLDSDTRNRKHFFLFRYSFETVIMGEDNNYRPDLCVRSENDDSDSLPAYQIVLICLGVLFFLIVFYCCCCRNKTIKESRDAPDCNNGNAVDDQNFYHLETITPAAEEEQIIHPRQTIVPQTPPSAVPDQSLQATPTPATLPSAPPLSEDPPDYNALFPAEGIDPSNT